MLSSSKLGWTCHGCLILFGAKDRRQLAENLILSSEANIALAMQELVQSCSILKHLAASRNMSSGICPNLWDVDGYCQYGHDCADVMQMSCRCRSFRLEL